MSRREPFVSGLAGADLARPRSLLATALPLLLPGRALLVDQIEELSPLCVSRWDGVEREAADEIAIAKRASLEAIVAVLDVIIRDEMMQSAIAQRLVNAPGRGR